MSYRKVIEHMGLSVDSQGEAGWLYLMLTALSEADTAGDTLQNPFADVLLRLSSHRETYAYVRMQKMFGALAG